MTQQNPLLKNVLDHLGAINTHLQSFPDTTDRYFGQVMIRTAMSVLKSYACVFMNPYGQGYRNLQALNNTLASGAHDDMTSLSWASGRQFFIFLKIVAAKLIDLATDPGRIALGLTGPYGNGDGAKGINNLFIAMTQYSRARAHTNSDINFLIWVSERLCGMSPLKGKLPYRHFRS